MTGQPRNDMPVALIIVALIAAVTVLCVMGPADWWVQ